MRLRLLTLLPVAGIALATTAYAGPTATPQVKDPAGDAVGAQAGTDIVSVLYTTSGTGQGKAYKPKELLVTMTLAGPVETTPGLTYEVQGTTNTCGDVTFTYEPGTPYEKVTGLNGWANWGSCTDDSDSNIALLTVTAEGNKLVWEFGLRATPLKVGTTFSAFEARVDPSNPVLPFPSSEQTGIVGVTGVIDVATSSTTWKVS
jgi:hypothetical protein